MSKQINDKFQKNHNTNDSSWKTINDYLSVIPDKESIIEKVKGQSYLTSCPLPYNHKHGDRHQSFIINEVVSDTYFYDDKKRYPKKIVVYTCLAKCCKQSDLASFFKGRLDHG